MFDDIAPVDLLSEGSVELLSRWTKKSKEDVVAMIREKFAVELEALDDEGCRRCDAYLEFLSPSSDSEESSEESNTGESSTGESSTEEESESMECTDSESSESSSSESSSEPQLPAKRKASVKLSFF